MPSISQKAIHMPSSPIRKLVPYAEDAKKRGVHVHHLNIGQPDIKTPEKALRAVREAKIDVLAYSRTEGSEVFREKIANYYQRLDLKVRAKDIVVTTGGSEGLSFALGALLDPNDELIVPEPFYANYSGFAGAHNIKIVPITCSFDTQFSLPSIGEFEKLITQKTKAILICNPSNPTGYVYSKEELTQLAQIALKHDLFILSDEVYREFVYDGAVHYSMLSFDALKEHVVVIDSVSKRYSMCGARIGFVVTQNSELRAAVLKFAQARLSPPTYAQIASEAALDTEAHYFEEVLREYSARRNFLVQALQKIPGVQTAVPKGAFYCIVKLPVKSAEDFAQWLLEHFSLDNETVMVAPAAGFYSTKGLGEDEVRIAYVLEIDALKRAVDILEKGLEAYLA
ncbi:MAG: pyridoxal phosphate-dependent aminotransferase [Bacteroidetes bacterium]|nr:pyridoxal phosphate-dependent aminotransferase [Bacteroidota bacterium]